MRRRPVLKAAFAAAYVPAAPSIARAATHGVTATEIRRGSTEAYKSPAPADAASSALTPTQAARDAIG